VLERNGRKAMSAKTDFTLSFDPDAWEFSVVTHTARSWLPSSIRSRRALDPRAWHTRAVRGGSWHRAGRAQWRELAR
jgi:hypothetical protein